MKIIILWIIFLLSTTSYYCQTTRETLSYIGINHSFNFLQDGHGLKNYYDNWTRGYFIEIGGKRFFLDNKNWFLSGGLNAFSNNLPCAKARHFRELGLGGAVHFGYDYIVGKNQSIEFFSGPGGSFALNLKPDDLRWHRNYHYGNFMWIVGTGYNYKYFNVKLSYNVGCINRARKNNTYDDNPYRVSSIMIGLYYRFSIKKELFGK